MQTQPARRGGKTRAVVVALRDEIQKAIDDGLSVMAIWKTLHADGSVQVGYHVFRRCVAKLLPRDAKHGRAAPPMSPDRPFV